MEPESIRMKESDVLQFIGYIRNQFEYYKSLGEKTFEQLSDEDLFWEPNDASNSIAVIVNHLSGNMLSRWTDFFTSDGEKSWRNRDSEFEVVLKNRTELEIRWQEGWNCLFQAFKEITPENFEQSVYIRNQKHTVSDALLRQLAHYSYHVGQIVYIGKIQLDDQWKSLSIPKGQSETFNRQKFSKGKHGGYFTDDLK